MIATNVLYKSTTVGSSHDDAHSDNSTLHTGAVRPHTGFVESLFFISPRTGHGSSQVFEMLPAFFVDFARVRFSCGGHTSVLFSGPVEAEGGAGVLYRRAGSSVISLRTLPLVKKTCAYTAACSTGFFAIFGLYLTEFEFKEDSKSIPRWL